ncbi:MAG: DUF4922 domain-containing protein [Bacteroidetes bacterium]|nr:DUF4922 domain-containing protein [Bacteroidota bacterium]
MNSIGNSFISKKTYAVFNKAGSSGSLAELCNTLLEQQKKDWPQLDEGYNALASVRLRNICCDGFSAAVQFNPGRIKSTAADLDRKTVRERKCFLCPENLPELQKGILYRNEYLLLCNPAPIFDRHLTFSSISHVPQRLESNLEILLNLAKDLNPEYTVFYNGPRCGASAPDHFHFQASPRCALPVERDAVDMKRRKPLYYNKHVAGCILLNYGRTVLIIESTDKPRLLEFISDLLKTWKRNQNIEDESMMNILCSYQEDLWRLIVMPRSKHRPYVFSLEEEKRVVVSPAAVDMGGLIIMPREKDFILADAKLIENIYSEVTEPPEMIERILGQLK